MKSGRRPSGFSPSVPGLGQLLVRVKLPPDCPSFARLYETNLSAAGICYEQRLVVPLVRSSMPVIC
jgi:hypothetical protein